jgi:Raf kinase inhibitor-like YbhB/YbcL family protein
MRRILLLTLAALVLLGVACKRVETQAEKEETGKKEVEAMALQIKSGAFENGATIPKKYTCDGEDLSPALSWSGVPDGTKSFALICDDPDAPMGTWVHWVLWGLPPDTMGLLEGVAAETSLTSGARQGINSGSRVGYNGPCPPPGKPHRYYFKLYALDTTLNLPSTANKAALEKAMKGHVLAEAQVMGKYGR